MRGEGEGKEGDDAGFSVGFREISWMALGLMGGASLIK